MHLLSNDIQQLESRYRAHLINSLSGYKSANLVATQSAQGASNLSIVSSVFHIGANPALIGFISRPNTVERHTIENIVATNYYTINQVHSDIYTSAHQTSARYPREQSEFNECGLTEYYSDTFYAPYVQESRIKYGVKLVEQQTLTVNNTDLIIGEIVEIFVPDNVVEADGHIDIAKTNAISVAGLDHYFEGKHMARLSYAKPNQKVEKI